MLAESCKTLQENQVTVQSGSDLRKAALESHLADFQGRGFKVESQTETQAVLVRRSRLAWFGKRNGSRLVIWVDEHGAVEERTIEARRW